MALAIFFPRYTKGHLRNEFPLNVIEICSMCDENHSHDNFPSIPSLKVVYNRVEGCMEKLFCINQRRPQGPKEYQQAMDSPSSFSTSYNAHF